LLSAIDVTNNVQQENEIWLSTIKALNEVQNVLKNVTNFHQLVNNGSN